MGEFFGQVIIIFYILTILKYVLKIITKLFGKKILEYKKFYAIYKQLLKIIMKGHYAFDGLTILFILTHFYIEFNEYGFSVTGFVAAFTIGFQVLLGLYALITKKINKYWLWSHRIITLIILLAILIHIS